MEWNGFLWNGNFASLATPTVSEVPNMASPRTTLSSAKGGRMDHLDARSQELFTHYRLVAAKLKK